jgi:hypothetical protein
LHWIARGLGAAIEPTSGDSKIDVDMDRRARGFIGKWSQDGKGGRSANSMPAQPHRPPDAAILRFPQQQQA